MSEAICFAHCLLPGGNAREAVQTLNIKRMAVLWISVVIVLFDQLTKMMIKGSPDGFLSFTGMPLGSSKPFIGEILRITFVENPGIAFGLTIPGFKVVFAVFSIVASIAILWYMWKNQHRMSKMERIAMALVLGGAVGNLIDRVFYGVIYGTHPLFYGRVVDFIDFGYQRNWWPVFNIADSAVSVGVTLLVAIILFRKKPAEQGPNNVSFSNRADSASVSFEKSAFGENGHPTITTGDHRNDPK